MNLLRSLRRSGQSLWLDAFERSWMSSGHLQQAIEAGGVRGVRSNFDALNLAIQGQSYDLDFSMLVQRDGNRSARSNYEYLLVRDLQLAADRLKQVHVHTQGRDGYVQVDLPPDTLFEAETAIATAQRIWQSVGWSNLLLRIPATQLLLPVIEHLIGDRINVNATLVFSPKMYEQVFDCYLRGLERLVRQGESVSNVVCFVSMSMGHLDAVIAPPSTNSEAPFSMTQAKLLYQHYQDLCRKERWRSLPEGIQPLRLIWDCTDIPPESTWRYIQTLEIPETVLMLKPSTLERYRQVSLLPVSLKEDEQAEQAISECLEIFLDEQVNQLMNQEMTRSLSAFQQLLDTIEHKRRHGSWMDFTSMVDCP